MNIDVKRGMEEYAHSFEQFLFLTQDKIQNLRSR